MPPTQQKTERVLQDNRALALGQKAKLNVTREGATLSFGR
jgi:hypothetical protein